MIKKDFEYFLKHQQELAEKYNGKYLVIKDEKIIGIYDTMELAYYETIKTHEIGTFFIQLCTPDEESYTTTFHSRAWL